MSSSLIWEVFPRCRAATSSCMRGKVRPDNRPDNATNAKVQSSTALNTTPRTNEATTISHTMDSENRKWERIKRSANKLDRAHACRVVFGCHRVFWSLNWIVPRLLVVCHSAFCSAFAALSFIHTDAVNPLKTKRATESVRDSPWPRRSHSCNSC